MTIQLLASFQGADSRGQLQWQGKPGDLTGSVLAERVVHPKLTPD